MTTVVEIPEATECSGQRGKWYDKHSNGGQWIGTHGISTSAHSLQKLFLYFHYKYCF